VQDSLKEAQSAVDEVRGQVVEALGGTGIPEGKVVNRLDEAIMATSKDREELLRGASAIEENLSKVEAEDRRINTGLIPVIRRRAELAKLEDDWKKAQDAHAADEAAAAELESIADQFSELHEALLAAKNVIATETLAAASPRAEALYRTLVRHPVFDKLQIKTAPKSRKIDYSFEVSVDGDAKSAREARLVLSDGQVTATAIGLFFALSDTDTHNLDLLYVDDPTQNLDLPCKEAMAKVVADIGKERQVIISTQDEDFVSFLEAEGFFDSAIVHHLERWDGNPVVNTRVAP
jgi:DNA repair exonuclease SbcCD ATPase subunit